MFYPTGLDDSLPFQLPIEHMDEELRHSLSPVIATDLELQNMYDYVFDVDHLFARELIPKFKSFSSSHEFLKDTQCVIKNMEQYSIIECPVSCETIKTYWSEVRHDPKFLETYGYLEWEILQSYNRSSTTLQSITMANMLSPLSSFILPLLLLIFPFLILKFQGVPITFEVYCEVLQSIAKNHFIGKAMQGSWTLDKCLYVAGVFGLYMLQMYQNTVQCMRFYRNTEKINTELCAWKDFVNTAIQNMKQFQNDLETYRPFCRIVAKHCLRLETLQAELDCIVPFQCSIYKTAEIGYLLKCYYELHVNEEYAESIEFAMGFDGYIHLLQGVYKNVQAGVLHYATFEDASFMGQYYPPHGGDAVKNDADLSTNMVITGPNASGKTTFLKTTALNIIFTQQLGVGFYESGGVQLYTHIHSYLNIPDTSGRDSLFQAESRRCKEILDKIAEFSNPAQYRHFCIFDELYSGTNPEEAAKTAFAFMKYISAKPNVDILLTTHYTSICEKWSEHGIKNIVNYQMEVIQENDQTTRTYCIKPGISHVQGAVDILREMDYPQSIIDSIREVTV